MVRPEGFEPPALGFEVRCSIQLSYERPKKIISSRCNVTLLSFRPARESRVQRTSRAALVLGFQ